MEICIIYGIVILVFISICAKLIYNYIVHTTIDFEQLGYNFEIKEVLKSENYLCDVIHNKIDLMPTKNRIKLGIILKTNNEMMNRLPIMVTLFSVIMTILLGKGADESFRMFVLIVIMIVFISFIVIYKISNHYLLMYNVIDKYETRVRID